jgi:uncharacterized delta-60 repeat protein
MNSFNQQTRPSNTSRKRYVLLLSNLCLLLALCGLSVQAAPGDLDVRFGTGGKVATQIGNTIASASALAIQPDGKLVVGGSSGNGATYDFTLARYNTDGTLDTTFNSTGIVITNIGGDDSLSALAIQADGKIVVGGSTTVNSYDFALARYNTDGSLDTTFNSTGKVVTTIISNDTDLVREIVIQPDGKIVAAGYCKNGATFDYALVRYNVNGSLDTTFNTTGKVITPVGNYDDFAYSVALQADGKIVAAGSSNTGTASDFYGTSPDFSLVRYNTDGSLDTTFNSTGKVTTNIGIEHGFDIGAAVAIQPDGKIVLAGQGVSSNNYDFALARYNTNGSLDTTLNSTGKVITSFGNDADGAIAVAIQPDGKIVTAGYTNYVGGNQVQDFGLVRYNPDGTLDTSFNSTGKEVTAFSNGDDYANAVALQPDGKIVAAGPVSLNGHNDFALVRYQGLTTTTAVNAGDILISEFRFNGPNGNAADEFVELYNNSNNDIMVSDPDGGAGWLLSRSNSISPAPQRGGRQPLRNPKLSESINAVSANLLIPVGTVLPAHRHFLITNTGNSLQNSGGINHAFPDLASTFDMPDNGGIALYASSLATGTRLDAVGFSTAGSPQFYEGTPLTPLVGAGASEQYSFIRKIINEVVQDTNDNATDFTLISTTATVGGTPAALGAPGPENLFSPIYKSSALITGQYLDPTAASTAPPNRTIESDILKFRRTYTNNTGLDVRRLRFRFFDLTTLNNTQGVPAPVADLRVISSQNETLNTAFGNKTALALTREEPPDQTNTTLDGGIHTTLSANSITLVNPLRAGQSIDVNFWLRRVAGGRFRFFVNIEATP